MKKIFLAAVTALALCSYGYAQDDEDEYEEEESTESVAPAPAVEEEEEEAPAPAKKETKKAKKKAKKSSGDGTGFLGISVGLDQNNIIDFEPQFFIGSYNYMGIMFKITPEMMVTAKFGFAHHGETSVEITDMPEIDGGDDFTSLLVGAQFDYFFATPLMPTSISAGFMYASAGETTNQDGDKSSASAILIDIMFNAHAPVTESFFITGSVGLGIEMPSTEETRVNGGFGDDNGTTKTETSRTDIGIKAGISFGWFFM